MKKFWAPLVAVALVGLTAGCGAKEERLPETGADSPSKQEPAILQPTEVSADPDLEERENYCSDWRHVLIEDGHHLDNIERELSNYNNTCRGTNSFEELYYENDDESEQQIVDFNYRINPLDEPTSEPLPTVQDCYNSQSVPCATPTAEPENLTILYADSELRGINVRSAPNCQASVLGAIPGGRGGDRDGGYWDHDAQLNYVLKHCNEGNTQEVNIETGRSRWLATGRLTGVAESSGILCLYAVATGEIYPNGFIAVRYGDVSGWADPHYFIFGYRDVWPGLTTTTDAQIALPGCEDARSSELLIVADTEAARQEASKAVESYLVAFSGLSRAPTGSIGLSGFIYPDSPFQTQQEDLIAKYRKNGTSAALLDFVINDISVVDATQYNVDVTEKWRIGTKEQDNVINDVVFKAQYSVVGARKIIGEDPLMGANYEPDKFRVYDMLLNKEINRVKYTCEWHGVNPCGMPESTLRTPNGFEVQGVPLER